MRIPAGKHTIEFRFDPPLAHTGDTIDLICNVLLILLIGFVIFHEGRNRRKEAVSEPTPIVPSSPEVPSGTAEQTKVTPPQRKTGGAKSR
ncbi:hypothetical protein GCM10028810_17170 [Spirosoma litoris]